ncbi:MAG: F0F1 ATP synthase subunit epsilon [Hyphomicrobiales bacterium]|nr:F0F1 ATP synthase subunit epsilon [Hyphomicrobiales bacterium]MBV8825667.1 F0F1 ATP synthase subunit epsilon [Hyphomicrobiales bacterium]MBV9427493.1 F0F1 ATP synthase subunit epsilon [Bradyrhizobiaceae bacterium]
MPDPFHFDLVSPEKMVFSGEVEQVDVPGAEGDFGVLAHHAPLIAMLKPGILTVFGAGETQRIVVVGGFAEVNEQGLTVLADMAMPVEDFDRSSLESQIKDAEEDVADASEDAERDAAREKLEQLKALQDALSH